MQYAIGFLFIIVALRPDLFSYLSYKSIYSAVSEFFPDKEPNYKQVQGDTEWAKMPDEQQVSKSSISQNYRYTDKQIGNAKDRVLREKKAQQWLTQEEIDQILTPEPEKETVTKPKIPTRTVYEIELFSGGVILTDNAVVTPEKVTYRSPKGLTVSINKYEIRSMKKLKVRR